MDTDFISKPNPRFYEADWGGLKSANDEDIYVLGIIDIFTEYNTKK